MQRAEIGRSHGEGPLPRDPQAILRQEITAAIRRLERSFSLELLSLAIFLLLSVFAADDFALFPSLPPAVRSALGRPPSTGMISAVLILYIFSSLMLTLSRMMSGQGKASGLAHVGYLAGFYGFYHFSGRLAENFWAVFAGGLTILILEAYHLWIYCSEGIGRQKERLRGIEDPPGS